MSSDNYQEELRNFLESVAKHGDLLRRQEQEGPNYATPNYRLNADERQLFIEELLQGSDRASAVLGAAHLDSQLEDLLACFMVDGSRDVRQLFKIGQPLGSFGVRITVAFGLGLITVDEHHDLKLIKKIRNDFAHDMYRRSFGDDDMTSRVNQLRGVSLRFEDLFRDKPKTRFVMGIATLVNQLGILIDSVSEQKRTIPPPRLNGNARMEQLRQN